MALSPRDISKRRAERTRLRLKAVSSGRVRLSVFRSSKNIYAQVIDDAYGGTWAVSSCLEAGKDGGNLSDKAERRAPRRIFLGILYDQSRGCGP